MLMSVDIFEIHVWICYGFSDQDRRKVERSDSEVQGAQLIVSKPLGGCNRLVFMGNLAANYSWFHR